LASLFHVSIERPDVKLLALCVTNVYYVTNESLNSDGDME